jgi:hypothetical protein
MFKPVQVDEQPIPPVTLAPNTDPETAYPITIVPDALPIPNPSVPVPLLLQDIDTASPAPQNATPSSSAPQYSSGFSTFRAFYVDPNGRLTDPDEVANVPTSSVCPSGSASGRKER